MKRCLSSQVPAKPQHHLCLAADCPSKAANCTSLATKLQELLSQIVFDTCGPALGDSTPRRPISAAQVAPSTIGVKDLFRLDRPVLAMPKPVATSQQASPQAARADEAIPISHSPSLTLALETPKVGLCPCHPATWDSSWDRPKCPLQQGTSTARGDEKGYGPSTYNQGIHRCPLQKAGIGL